MSPQIRNFVINREKVTMARKRATVNVTGMNRDMAKGVFDPRFTFENMNIRVTARDDACTAFAVTNEKGTRLMGADVLGEPVGVFSCDSFFGIFSHDGNTDIITVYELKDGDAEVYFRWSGTGLGFSECAPATNRIETEVSVEASNSTRVYWVDGVHQPRVLDFKRLREKYGVVCDDTDSVTADHFNFLPVIREISGFKVEKRDSGHYYSGTVQFVVTEVVNCNESNIAYYSPLYYASDDANERGFKPDNDTVGCSFRVTFTCGGYKSVDYFVVYAIHRATRDGAAVVTRQEVATANTCSVLMTGLEEAVESSKLLFMNRQPMTGAKTMTQKDGVLFIGGWEGNPADKEREVRGVTVKCVGGISGRSVPTSTLTEAGVMGRSQLRLSSFDIGHFKKGEGYMLGYQTMDRYGRWGAPKLIKNDSKDLFPMTEAAFTIKNAAYLPYFEATVEERDAVMIRPVVAYLDESQKPSLYQGILTPTVYCEKERVDGTCYAKISPFTRSFRNYGSSFKPSLLWANPRSVITDQGKKELAADVYLNYCGENVVSSFSGFGYTAVDAGVKKKSSMQYGTYPASQHLQALGTTKDYNNELQTSWRYRDVVFKTSMIPYGDSNTTGESSNIVVVTIITLTFDVMIKWMKPAGEVNYINKYWKENFYIGLAGSQYKFVYYDGVKDVSKKDGDTLVNGGYGMTELMGRILWSDGGGIFECGLIAEKETKEDGTTGYKVKNTFDNKDVTFTSIEKDGSSALSARCYCDLTKSAWTESSAQSQYNDKEAKHTSRLSEKLKSVFGAYVTSSSTMGTDSGTDVFTIDNTSYFVDAEVVTMHSPDLIDGVNMEQTGGSVRVMGVARMGGFISDTSVIARMGKIGTDTKGAVGFQNLRPYNDEAGRCAMALPNWNSHWDDVVKDRAELWSIPPFGVDDYLALVQNNMKVENKKDSELTYHQLSNYRFCDTTKYYKDAETASYDGLKTISGASVSLTPLSSDGLVYKPAEDTAIIPSLAYFWSNGPYYTTDGDRRKKGEKGGIKNISKFNNQYTGHHWQQLGYATHWLLEDDITHTLDINMVPLMTHMSVVNAIKNRGEWIFGNTVDDAKIEVEGNTITGAGNFSYKNAPFVSYKMNEYKRDGICLESYGIGSDLGHDGFMDQDDDPDSYTINLKYCSTFHAVLKLPSPMWEYGYLAKYAVSKARMYGSAGWKHGNDIVEVSKAGVSAWRTGVNMPSDISSDDDCLWIVDIVNNGSEPKVNTATAEWLIAGEAVNVVDGKAKIKWMQGDWYFQRYDCLRTYPASVEDKNQVVEIVSFMCETRRNLCGRYDSHGGKAFLQANPSNYGFYNDSYTQKNNFFTYSMAGENDNVETSYPCTLTWSLPKTLNSNVDSWTSITGSNILDLEGDKGPVVHLARLGNSLFCFQPSGIAMVLYNERTPISTDGGTPIELGMSGKVDGKVYIANSAGALRNINIVATDGAVYFMDTYNKSLCALGENVRPLSDELGFHSWAASLSTPDKLRLHYDRRNGCVMATDDSQALIFSEKLGQFESFMSYEGTFEGVNVQDRTILLHTSSTPSHEWRLWEINGGEYNIFFGSAKDYWVDMLIGGGPTDKVFDNVEFRGDLLTGVDELKPKRCPFNTIRAYNEYQDSMESPLKFNQFSLSALKNRFRSWHAFVPRNSERRVGRLPERMRNPWCHVVLLMRQPEDGEPETGRAQIQDMNVDYTE